MILPNIFQYFVSRSSFTRKITSKYYYQFTSPLIDTAGLLFMNYGYVELEMGSNTIMLDESDEPHRLPIQLYHHLASAVDLEGRDVLEVSCGRGGGAAFVKRYHRPRSLVGIDLTLRSIAFCQQKHQENGLSFLQCEAEAIGFGDECFDAVLNVEASHLYGRVDTFLAEVRRLLRNGGHLLLADKRTLADAQLLRQQISDSGLQIVIERDISANVLQALHLQQAHRIRRIKDQLPSLFAWLFIHIFGVDGSHLKDAISTGHTVYLCYILRKV